MFPKVGDIVYFNHDFLKVWFRRGNRYLKEEVWKESFTITEVRDLKNEFIIYFESKDYRKNLFILPNGELSVPTWFDEYKGIQVFISANTEISKNNIYCSCGGPKKENWVFGERFYICTVCKKEAI